MEKLFALMAGWTGQSPEEVKALVETKPDDLAQTLSGYKVLSNDAFNTALDNRVKSLGEGDAENLPDTVKRKFYAINKASALEAAEKDLQSRFGTTFLQGKDYNNIVELTQKIIGAKAPDKEGDSKYKDLYTTAQVDFQKQLEEKDKHYLSREKGLILDGAINALNPFILDKEGIEPKKKYLRYSFDDNFDLDHQDGKTIVLDKATKKPVVDSNHAMLSVEQVIKQLATGVITLAETVPISGRGANNEPGTQTPNPKKYSSDDEFIEKELKGKGINPFSTEGIKALRDYQKGEVTK